MMNRASMLALGMCLLVRAAAPATAGDVVGQALLANATVDKVDVEGWPRQGKIAYRVLLGSKGYEVGKALHTWSHDDVSYRMEVKLETTGLIATLGTFRYTQRSEGELGSRGLKPLRFNVEQSMRKPDAVEFDWAAGNARILRGGKEPRTERIMPGDQDVLSLWHQIGIVGVDGLPTTLTVLSNKSAKPASLELVGRETQQLPIGRLDTVRLRAKAEDGSLTIDIWLSSSHAMMPVRIRIADDDGETLDQQATELQLTPSGKGVKSPPAA